MLDETPVVGAPHLLALPQGALLQGQYRVEGVLGVGGFAITYLVRDLSLDTFVAVKEFLPRELVGRGNDRSSVLPYSTADQEAFRYGLSQFVGEARLLARVNHPNVVRVRSFFE